MMLLLCSLFILANVVQSGTGAYYGSLYCGTVTDYNFSWYPLMDITINTSNINSQYQYLYSPCNLSFYSTELDQHFAMIRYDLTTKQEQYLIPGFPYGSAPKKDSNQPITTWKYEYSYPNISCPNGVQIVQIYWQCNETVLNFPDYNNVISAGPLFDCFDSVFLQSPFACPRQSGWPDYQPECSFSSNGKSLNPFDYPVKTSYPTYIWHPCHNVKIPTHLMDQNNYATLYPTGANTEAADVYATWGLSTPVEYYYDPIINVWNATLFGYNITHRIGYNGPTYHCDVFATYIIYGCNCYTDNRLIVDLIQVDQECNMIINVTRYDLCINYIDQCYPDKNNTDCVYYYRDDDSVPYDKLNLSALTNTQIGDVEPGGLYAFIYTPCNNNFMCNTPNTQSNSSVVSMAGRRSINSNQCVDPLAIFNGTQSFNVSHEVGSNTWIIEYFNGECPTNPDLDLRFRTKWNYVYQIEWRVNYAEFKEDDCLYDVSISTQYSGH